MNVLVTGATGLVGSTLTKQLIAHGASVRIFRRSTSRLDLLGAAASSVEHATGDLMDARSLCHAMEGVQHVYHVAAALGVGSTVDSNTLYRVNVEGTANVVNAALSADVSRLVYTSSMAAFGHPKTEDRAIDETASPQTPFPSPYAQSKYRAELEIQRGIAEGVDAVIVNPALIFGVGRPGENTRRIVDLVRSGWLPGVPPGGTNVVDVEDVAEGHRRAMAHGETGERYFLGSENLSWHAIVATLSDAFGIEPPRRTLPSWLLRTGALLAEGWAFVTRTRPLLTRSAVESASRVRRYDNTKAIEKLGCSFRPFTETAQRLARAIDASPSSDSG